MHKNKFYDLAFNSKCPILHSIQIQKNSTIKIVEPNQFIIIKNLIYILVHKNSLYVTTQNLQFK